MTVRIHLQVSMSSPNLLDELRRYTDPRGRAARLKALAELGLRVERGLVPLPDKLVVVRPVAADAIAAPALPSPVDPVATPTRPPRARKSGAPFQKAAVPRVVEERVAPAETDGDVTQDAKDDFMRQLMGG